MGNETETTRRPLSIKEYESVDCVDVFAMSREMSYSGVMTLPPSDNHEDRTYVLTLEGFDRIFLSEDQAKAIALAVAKVAVGEKA